MTILKYLINNINIRPKEITMISHVTAEVNFATYQETNDCLNFIEQIGTEGDFSARTEARFTCKGVITDWPDTVKELWEAITGHAEIIKIEKMYRYKCGTIKIKKGLKRIRETL